MAAQRAALVIDPAPDVREMLRIVLEDDGYAVETTPDATAGLQVLRDSTNPMTVLFDVLPLPDLTREKSGLAILDALAPDSPETDRLARNGYVLMSTNVKLALAGVETVPPSLQILPKPFRLEALRASLEAVAEWLRTNPVSQAFTSTGAVARAYANVKASRQHLADALARLEQGSEPSIRRRAVADVDDSR